MKPKERQIAICFLVWLIVLYGIHPCHVCAQKEESKPPPSAIDTLLKEKVPVETENIDKAGKEVGKRIDRFGRNAARYLGNWVNGKVFSGITWLKLIICAVLILVVIGAERALWAVIRLAKRRLTGNEISARWKLLLIEAFSKPLSVAILVYGLYGALSPLYGHFADTAVRSAKKIADIGGTLAVILLVYMLVRLIYAQTIRWSASVQTLGGQISHSFLINSRKPLNFMLILILIRILFPLLEDFPRFTLMLQNSFAICLIGSAAWLMIQGTYILEDVTLRFYNIDVRDNLLARKVLTQVRFVKQFIITIVIVVAIASMLMIFDKVRQFGMSILASAGLMGMVIGLAAQKSVTNILTGFQIAITQPIRIDDVVIVENEYGNIEEITSTYVVVRVWDLRRIIVPLTYFAEKPFQNWTRISADLLGTVFIYADYSISVDAVREELYRILQNSSLWDKKVWALHVTNTTEKTMELRALMSAADASMMWDLRCEVREKLITFIRQRFPDGFPKLRAELPGITRNGGISHAETHHYFQQASRKNRVKRWRNCGKTIRRRSGNRIGFSHEQL